MAAALIAMWESLPEAEKARLRPRLDLAPASVLTPKQAAGPLGISAGTITRMCRAGRLGHRVAGRWRVEAAEVRALLGEMAR